MKATAEFDATIQQRPGIDRFHVHMTRHTYACRFLEAGGELVALQQILRHSSWREGDPRRAARVFRGLGAEPGKKPGNRAATWL